MAEPVRHRQTKEAATDMFDLQPPRHIPTLPKTDLTGLKSDFCFTLESGLKLDIAPCPSCADCVEKLENRGAPKISQM
jgi:hypothetical protein